MLVIPKFWSFTIHDCKLADDCLSCRQTASISQQLVECLLDVLAKLTVDTILFRHLVLFGRDGLSWKPNMSIVGFDLLTNLQVRKHGVFEDGKVVPVSAGERIHTHHMACPKAQANLPYCLHYLASIHSTTQVVAHQFFDMI